MCVLYGGVLNKFKVTSVVLFVHSFCRYGIEERITFCKFIQQFGGVYFHALEWIIILYAIDCNVLTKI